MSDEDVYFITALASTLPAGGIPERGCTLVVALNIAAFVGTGDCRRGQWPIIPVALLFHRSGGNQCWERRVQRD
ncbi:hypothetical protein [Nisaea sp.]|uniref:hypothetical protein n=1 Tax=Nisaea sp. TaxID=2024842 RepID=UPI0032F04DA5